MRRFLQSPKGCRPVLVEKKSYGPGLDEGGERSSVTLQKRLSIPDTVHTTVDIGKRDGIFSTWGSIRKPTKNGRPHPQNRWDSTSSMISRSTERHRGYLTCWRWHYRVSSSSTGRTCGYTISTTTIGCHQTRENRRRTRMIREYDSRTSGTLVWSRSRSCSRRDGHEEWTVTSRTRSTVHISR